MKGILHRAVLALLFVAIVLLASFAIFSSGTVEDPEHVDSDKTNYSCNNCKIEIKQNETFFEALATDPVAFFTAVLAFLTLVLAIISAGQIYLLARADETSRRSADAALKAATVAERALEGGETPFLLTTIRCDRRTTDISRVTYFVDVYIKNLGRSPAFIYEIHPVFGRNFVLPDDVSFPLPKRDLQKIFAIEPQAEILVHTFNGVLQAVKAPRWAGMYIWFGDVFGNQFLSAYCARYDGARNAFLAQGGAARNYRRKLTEEEINRALKTAETFESDS